MTLEQLQQQLAAIPEDGQLPASATQADLAVVRARRVMLDARITSAKSAMAVLPS